MRSLQPVGYGLCGVKLRLLLSLIGARRAAPGGNLTALAALLKKRFEEKYSFRKALHGNAALRHLVAEIERGEQAPDALRSQISRMGRRATLGSSACPPAQSMGPSFAVWVDRWRLIGWPSLGRARGLERGGGQRLSGMRCSACLLSEPSLTGWEETRAGFIRQIGLRTDQPPEIAERHVPAFPATSARSRALAERSET